MNILAKLVYGSRLYGVDIPTSDFDYRSIYLPTIQDAILGRIKHAYEDKSEEDTSIFSLHHFLSLASQGQSIAIELLSAPLEKTVSSSVIWEVLRANRKRFYTKNMYSFLGFSKSISTKYSLRAERLAETKSILDVVKPPAMGSEYLINIGQFALASIWDKLPESLNAKKTVNERNAGAEKRVYQVCGREIQATARIAHAYEVVKVIYDSYGERVKNIKDGKIDYKALSHAFRAALQCEEIVETGDLVFPLKDAEWLRDLRLGKIDFFTNSLDQKLDDLIAEVQVKIDNSDLPDKVDQKWVDSIILNAYNL